MKYRSSIDVKYWPMANVKYSSLTNVIVTIYQEEMKYAAGDNSGRVSEGSMRGIIASVLEN